METNTEETVFDNNNGWETIETTNSENQPLTSGISKKKKMIKIKIQKIKTKIINKGTGAGGANTNKNGLIFEEVVDLKDGYESIQPSRNGIGSEVTFKGYLRTFIEVSKSALHKYSGGNGQIYC